MGVSGTEALLPLWLAQWHRARAWRRVRQTAGGKEKGEEGGRVKLAKVLISNGSLGLSHDLVGFSVFQIRVAIAAQVQ